MSPRRSSDDSFDGRVLTWPLALSTLPRTRVVGMCHCVPKILGTNGMAFEMNAGPLSDCMDLGSPNLGKISFMRWEQTTSSVSVMSQTLSVSAI